MTTLEKTIMRCTPAFMFVAVIFFVFMISNCAVAGKTKKDEKKDETSQYTVAGSDPKAFADSEAMHKLTVQRFLNDITAMSILSDLDTSLKEDVPWSPVFYSNLERLREVWIPDNLSLELRNTASKMVVSDKAPSQPKINRAKEYFLQGNAHYEAGRFDKAIESYRMALKEYPGFLDAWNNMALSEMHNNNDWAALFLFSALSKNNPKYVGASINLSVCLERLGQAAAAYEIADDLARKNSQMPMIEYNMAWFENSRGKYDLAQTHLSNAIQKVPDYSVAKWLQTINSMESGSKISLDDLKTLPVEYQSQDIPEIISRSVIANTADAYSGNTVAAKIPKGSKMVISEKTGDWNAVYWPAENVKRRLWLNQSSLSGNIITATDELKAFLGTWSEKWSGIHYKMNITIKEVDGKPVVTKDKWNVWDEKIEKGVLSFRVKGGASKWEFLYTVAPKPDKMALEVYRVHDKKRFTGVLYK